MRLCAKAVDHPEYLTRNHSLLLGDLVVVYCDIIPKWFGSLVDKIAMPMLRCIRIELGTGDFCYLYLLHAPWERCRDESPYTTQ